MRARCAACCLRGAPLLAHPTPLSLPSAPTNPPPPPRTRGDLDTPPPAASAAPSAPNGPGRPPHPLPPPLAARPRHPRPSRTYENAREGSCLHGTSFACVFVVLCTGARRSAPVVRGGGHPWANQAAGPPQPPPHPSLHARRQAPNPLSAIRAHLRRLEGLGVVPCTFCAGLGCCNINPTLEHFASFFCTVVSCFLIHFYSMRQGMNLQSEMRFLESEMNEL